MTSFKCRFGLHQRNALAGLLALVLAAILSTLAMANFSKPHPIDIANGGTTTSDEVKTESKKKLVEAVLPLAIIDLQYANIAMVEPIFLDQLPPSLAFDQLINNPACAPPIHV